MPLGGIFPELLLKCVREQEKATQSDVKFESPVCDEIQSWDRESVSDDQSGLIGDCKHFGPSVTGTSMSVVSNVSPEWIETSTAVLVGDELVTDPVVSSSVSPELCCVDSKAAVSVRDVVERPAEVIVSPESVASKAVKIVEEVGKKDTSVVVGGRVLRKRKQQEQKVSEEDASDLVEENELDLGFPSAVDENENEKSGKEIECDEALVHQRLLGNEGRMGYVCGMVHCCSMSVKIQ